jgi:hypothetical protein
MISYKFLRAGRTGPFSGFSWPEPGTWVRAGDDTAVCARGIHACRVRDLPWWLAEELWEVELDGEIEAAEHKLVAPAGRLRARIDRWTSACAEEFAEACAWRALEPAIEALRRSEHEGAARRLASCSTLDEVADTTRRLAEHADAARNILTIAGDGAVSALAGSAPTVAYIAAHAALRLDPATGYAHEREWQSRWLVERLGLSVTDRPTG